MILDYVPSTQSYVVRVAPLGDLFAPKELMEDYGLDMSITDSTPYQSVLFTPEPYAAACFTQWATPEARARLEPITREVEASWAMDAPGNFDVPPDKELWPFQRGTVSYARSRRNVLIGDEPGLGKTETAIVLCNEWRARRNVVICPASIRLQWCKRIMEWTTQPYSMIRAITKGKQGIYELADWTVISYELARDPGLGAAIARMNIDALILDEAHFAKTNDARRTRAIFGGGKELQHPPFASRAQHIVALTGTPLPNRPRECYTLTRGLCWDAIDWMSEDRFKERFNPSRMGMTAEGKIYVDERTGRSAELGARLRANLMVRHLKRDCMPQLKMPVYDLVYAYSTGPVALALRAETLLDINPDELEGDFTLMGKVATVRRQMGMAIAPQVADYVRMLLVGGEEKLVLFAWHREVMDYLQAELQEVGVLRVDGTTSPSRKDAIVSQFQRDPNIHVVLGNLLSLGTGVDGLQHACNHAIIAEPSWTPGENIQAFDRLDRGGQTRQVQGEIFVAPDSIAEHILASALRKLDVIHNTLDRSVHAS